MWAFDQESLEKILPFRNSMSAAQPFAIISTSWIFGRKVKNTAQKKEKAWFSIGHSENLSILSKICHQILESKHFLNGVKNTIQ